MYKNIVSTMQKALLPTDLILALKEADIFDSIKTVKKDNFYYNIELNTDHIESEHLEVLIKLKIDFKIMVTDENIMIVIFRD